MTVAELDARARPHRGDHRRGVGGRPAGGARRSVRARDAEAEVDFVVRLLTGELRQGALAGLMTDAIALATDVPATAVRRAAMLSGRPRRRRAPGAHRRRGRTRRDRLGGAAPGPAHARRDRGRRWPTRWPRPAARPSNGSSTARASRCTAPATTCASFTRNLNDITARVPEVVEVVRAFPARRFVLDGEAIGLTDDALPRRFQDTMSRFGTDDAASHAHDARPVLLRRVASRRRRPARPDPRRAGGDPHRPGRASGASRRSPPTIPTRPRPSCATRSRPATKA